MLVVVDAVVVVVDDDAVEVVDAAAVVVVADVVVIVADVVVVGSEPEVTVVGSTGASAVAAAAVCEKANKPAIASATAGRETLASLKLNLSITPRRETDTISVN